MAAGLATQAVPLYLSEIAPVHIRGQLNIMFQLSITIGILIAQIINYGAPHAPLLCVVHIILSASPKTWL